MGIAGDRDPRVHEGDEMRPHPWLYEHDHDARLVCEKCIHFGEPNDHQIGGKCGRVGWICGDFRLNEEYQISMELRDDDEN